MRSGLKLEDLGIMRGAVVVAAGGHLEQAIRRVSQFRAQGNVTFIVPCNSHSVSKLTGTEHLFIKNVRSRDISSLVVALTQLLTLIKKKRFEYVLSTGAGVAIAAYLICSIKRIPFVYIESIARQQKPSFTGKVLQFLRCDQLYSESDQFDRRRWKKLDSFFSNYQVAEKSQFDDTIGLRIFVTVGTVHRYKFPRIVHLVRSATRKIDTISWQIGNLDPKIIGVQGFSELPDAQFVQNIEAADVVITHAGVGSILTILDLGKFPILIPRLAEYDEHIDDHQLEISDVIENRQLATVITGSLTRSDLVFAANRVVLTRQVP